MYQTGRGVPKDEAEAVKWYRKAAEQGHATGQMHLARMLIARKGAKQDIPQAALLLARAAAQEEATAKNELAALLKNDIQARKVQTHLKELGLYTGAIDGVFGNGSYAALRAYCECSF